MEAFITLETLLDQAEALLEAHPDQQPPRPDFPLPDDYEEGTPFRFMKLEDNGLKGRGWFAAAQEHIPAGTVLVCEKPMAMIMDWQDPTGEAEVEYVERAEEGDGDDDDESMEENAGGLSKLNELLLLELLKGIAENPSLWTDKLSELFPRTDDEMEVLDGWVCSDDAFFVQFESQVEMLLKSDSDHRLSEADVAQLSKRLPLIVRYNVLSVETSPELMVHPSPRGYAALSGTGLYYLPSFFNHDCQPNASRYCVGDVMWVVANQDITMGQEICISYLEHEVLCEPAAVRTSMLNMDFSEPEQEGQEEMDDEAPDIPVVDADVQNELMAMNPMERLVAIDQLTSQALGEAIPEEEVDRDDMEVAPWFDCDVQNLRILKALTLDSMGRIQEALSLWLECVVFCETKLPPNDEASVVMNVQAALCAMQGGKNDLAKHHATKALQTHNVLFGGGVRRFRRRYEREFHLALRPVFSNGGPEDLWPMLGFSDDYNV